MKQPATLPTLRRQGAALTVLALAVVLAALAGLCFGSQGYTLAAVAGMVQRRSQNAVYRVLLHALAPHPGRTAGRQRAGGSGRFAAGRAEQRHGKP